MKAKLILLFVLFMTGVSAACFRYKQCCYKDYMGLHCVTKCATDLCPVSHPIALE